MTLNLKNRKETNFLLILFQELTAVVELQHFKSWGGGLKEAKDFANENNREEGHYK